MTLFDAMFASRAAPTLLVQFGEPVVYTPRNGIPRTIQAIVSRFSIHGPSEAPEVLSPMVEIEVLNDPVLGINCGSFDSGGDTVTVPLWPGKPATVLPIVNQMDATDNGLLKFRCGG